LSVTLLALVALRRVHVPNLLKGDLRKLSLIAGITQFVLFVLLLAALANNVWSKYDVSVPTGFGTTTSIWYHFGLTSASSRGDTGGTNYDCGDVDSSIRTVCRTYKAAGAFTLIFGLLAIFSAFFLLVVATLTLLGKEISAVVRYAHPLVPMVALIQFVALQAMVLIWGVSGHDLLKQQFTDLEIGASWALCFVACVLSIGTAIFYSQGVGVPYRGEPAYASGPEVAKPEAPATVV